MVTIEPVSAELLKSNVDVYFTRIMDALDDVLERTARRLDPHDPIHSSRILRTFWKSKVDKLIHELSIDFHYAAGLAREEIRTAVTAAVDPLAIPEPQDLLAEIYLHSRRRFLLDIGDDTWDLVREQLLQGLQANEGIPAMRDRVRAVSGMSEARAERVARTEVVGATNAGAYEQMIATGFEMTKTWLATNDERTRPSHADADGQTVGLKEKFEVGGVLMDRPHDPAAPPDEIIQCRCTLTFEMPDNVVTAAAFGKPNQPRDYHGRWGKGGKGGKGGSENDDGSGSISGDLNDGADEALTGQTAYDHVVENQGRVTDPTQKRALNDYVDDSSALNDKLRAQKSTTLTDKRAVAIKKAMDQGALTDQPILVHRAVSSAETVFGTKDLNTLVGAKVTDHGFMSTTSDRATAEWFVGGDDGAMFNITVPARTKVLAIDPARGSKPTPEMEILLGNGTSLKITNVARDKVQGWNIDAEVV